MISLSLEQLAEIVGGRLTLGSPPPLGGEWDPAGRMVAEIERVQPGDIFWGFAADGEDDARKADEALARGAQGVVVAHRPIEPWAGRFTLRVENTRWAWWKLARHARAEFTGRVIMAAGGLGKSSALHLIDQVLGRVAAGTMGQTRGDLGIELPRLFIDAAPELDYSLIDLGSVAAEELGPAVHLGQPHLVVLVSSTGGPAAAGATELLENLKAPCEAIIWGDDIRLERAARMCHTRVTLVGRGSHCDLAASEVRCHEGRLAFRLDGAEYDLPLEGRHFLPAALTAIAIGRRWGISDAAIAASLQEAAPPARRCQLSRLGELSILDDTEHSGLISLTAALEALRDAPTKGRRIVVLGSLETDRPDQSPRQAARDAGRAVVIRGGADLLLACGPMAGEIVRGAIDAGMPRRYALTWNTVNGFPWRASAGDVVLAKGSDLPPIKELFAAKSLPDYRRAAA